MNRTRKHQQGFTLIELMVVIGIIGILAALAIPAYKDYTVRARIGEGLARMTEAKSWVSEYYAIHGNFPSEAANIGSLITRIETENVYLMDINWSGAADEPIYIIIGVRGQMWGGAGNYAFSLEGTARGTGMLDWRCLSADPIVGWDAVPPQYMPSNCRETI